MNIEKLVVTLGCEGFAGFDTVNVTLNQTINKDVFEQATEKGLYRAKVIERVREPLRPEHAKALIRFDDFFALMMQSENTVKLPNTTGDNVIDRSAHQIILEIQSLQILPNRQRQLDTFLTQMNQCIVSAMKHYPIIDSAGQAASHIIFLSHEQKLRLTIKFARPHTFPGTDWFSKLCDKMMGVLTLARYSQLHQGPPNPQNARYCNAIQNQTDLYPLV